MRQALSLSIGTRYGLARTCRVWRVARSTIYWRRLDPAESRRRPGPNGPYPDDDLIGHMRTVLQASPFHGEGYRQVWARLRYRRTRKEHLLWIRTFDTVEELRVALLEFREAYNATWIIGRHGDKTPSQIRQEQRVVLTKQAA